MANIKKQVYEYNSKGKLLKVYSSHDEVIKKYFKGSKRPLFQYKDYYILNETSLITSKRMGRDMSKNILKMENNPYLRLGVNPVQINVKNLKNEVIATFQGVQIASLMTKVPITTIHHQLYNNSSKTIRNKSGLTFELK